MYPSGQMEVETKGLQQPIVGHGQTEESERLFEFATSGNVEYSQPHGRSKDGSPEITDEVFNAASHLVGALLSILGLSVLVAKSSVEGKVWGIVTFSIYGASLISLFMLSFLHHGCHSVALDSWFRLGDYASIYLLIAGTFTPLCLVFFHDTWYGWTFFGVVWAIACAGIATHAIFHNRVPSWLSMTLYCVMGWTGVFVAIPLYNFIGYGGLFLLGLGGILYTGGAVVFLIEKPNPLPGTFGFHEIWHMTVLLGAFVHWLLMYFYVQPYKGS